MLNHNTRKQRIIQFDILIEYATIKISEMLSQEKKAIRSVYKLLLRSIREQQFEPSVASKMVQNTQFAFRELRLKEGELDQHLEDAKKCSEFIRKFKSIEREDLSTFLYRKSNEST